MIKSIRFWLLKCKLAGLFKQAEYLQSIGVEAGDERYVQLNQQAVNLVSAFTVLYEGEAVCIPALEDLRKLSIKPIAEPIGKKIAMFSALAISTLICIGAGAQFVHLGYMVVGKIFGQ